MSMKGSNRSKVQDSAQLLEAISLIGKRNFEKANIES